MESLIVLSLGIGYLWNRSRKIQSNLESVPDDQELKQAQRPVGDNYDSYYTEATPKAQQTRLEAERARKEHEIQEFNGGVGEITGEYLSVPHYS